MPIDPRLQSGSVGNPRGVATMMSDVKRRLAQLEAKRTIINPGTITGGPDGKIAANTITAANLTAGVITADYIAAGAIETFHITAGGLEADAIAAGAIVAEKIAAGAVAAGKLAAGAVTAGTIAAGAINTNDLAANSVTADKIAANSVTAAKIAANSVTADKIASDAIETRHIKANQIEAAQIKASQIKAEHLVADQAMSDTIYNSLLLSEEIVASGLSAISANIGNITSGTITGAVFRTSPSNPRVQMDSTGITAIDANDNVTFKADAATGKIITLAGVGGMNYFKNAGFLWYLDELENPVVPGDPQFGWDEHGPVSQFTVIEDEEAPLGRALEIQAGGADSGFISAIDYKVPKAQWRIISVWVDGDGTVEPVFETEPDEMIYLGEI
jgi:predicted small secreted protein